MEKQYKLRKEFGVKWIEALRSEEYEQGNGFLEDDQGRFCCLGVFCKAHFPKYKILNSFYIETKANAENHKGVSKTLVNKVPSLLIGNTSNSFVKIVSRMNDDGYTFNDIADYIEQNVEFV